MIIVGENFGLNDRYKVLEILGEGGMGVVFKAYDNILKEFVAIKTLHTNLASNDGVTNRFLNEAKVCLNLTHPNIIRVRDVSIFRDIYYMVMEYIDGVELKLILKDLKNEDIKSVYLLIRPILEALQYAHKYTIHRDIKPSNIMVKDNIPYLMDFGISKALEDSELINHTIIGGMGTKKYVSPEQMFNANDVDKRTDIYSMGILLYELFTKQIPRNTAIAQPEKLSLFNKNISSKLENIILKMIEPKVNMRLENFETVLLLLDNAILIQAGETESGKIGQNDRVNKEQFLGDNLNNLDNMVLIPKGNFLRGSGLESKIQIEKPRKSIYLDEFYICKYCVTNKEYDDFLKNTNYEIPLDFKMNLQNNPNHPVVNVSYLDALEYCKYKLVSLPTEAQWEKAAKGGNNLIYPWGNEFDINKANIAYNQHSVVPVDDYVNGINPYELYNIAGNVWEWCLDDFVEDAYRNENSTNPLINSNSDIKILRGGSFDFVDTAARTSFRFHSYYLTKENNIGFRIVINKGQK